MKRPLIMYKNYVGVMVITRSNSELNKENCVEEKVKIRKTNDITNHIKHDIWS